MKKNHTINIRVSEKTLEHIENIRKQMIELHGFEEEILTNSFIIRKAILTFDKKCKYFIYEEKIDFYKNKKS